MRLIEELAAGAVLLISGSGLSNVHDSHGSENFWTWERQATLPRFVLVLGADTWGALTRNVLGSFGDQMADNGVHEAVDWFIRKGMAPEPNACPDRYELDQTGYLPDGSALLMGHCVAQVERPVLDGDDFDRAMTEPN
jgi:hypothetical protein